MESLIVVFAIAVAVVAIFWGIRKLVGRNSAPARKSRAAPSAAQAQDADTRWRAVRISPGLICCAEVAGMRDQVFLSRLSPTLPLDNCNEKDCCCKYVHLEDRRSGSDRRVQLGELENYLPFNQTDRRQSEGRRAADLAA